MPPVSEDGMPLEVLRGLPFMAHQAKQIEMSGRVRVVVACQNTLHVVHKVLHASRRWAYALGAEDYLAGLVGNSSIEIIGLK